MDTNNQNQQKPLSEQPEHSNAVTAVQQPPDAQPVVLPVDPTPPNKSEEQQPATISNMPSNESHPSTPGDSNPAPHKKPLMLILGVFIVVMLLAGGALYVMGLANRTQRLGIETKKSLPANMEKPTTVPSVSPEDQELNAIDLGDPENELKVLDTELNTLQ